MTKSSDSFALVKLLRLSQTFPNFEQPQRCGFRDTLSSLKPQSAETTEHYQITAKTPNEKSLKRESRTAVAKYRQGSHKIT